MVFGSIEGEEKDIAKTGAGTKEKHDKFPDCSLCFAFSATNFLLRKIEEEACTSPEYDR